MRCWTCFSVSCHCSTPNFRRGPTILVGPPSLSKNYCFPILCRVSEAGVGADASVRPMSSREFSQYSVGADAYIGPPGSCEFAADYRKNGAICRVDVGIDPYTETGSACVCAAAFRKISCTLPGGQRRPPIRSRTISIVIGLFRHAENCHPVGWQFFIFLYACAPKKFAL